jgi:hypothetical protein
MQTFLSTLINRPEAQVGERLNALLNVLSEHALKELFFAQLPALSSGSPLFKRLSEKLMSVVLNLIAEGRLSGPVGNEVFSRVQSIAQLEDLASTTGATARAAKAYLLELPENVKGKDVKTSTHTLVYTIISKVLRAVLENIDDGRRLEKAVRPSREGDVISEGPGFEAVVGQNHRNHVRYPDGDAGVAVIHDIREGHFLMVERYDPIQGLFLLEFPRCKSTHNNHRLTAINVELREQAGLSIRDLEIIGVVSPESMILQGRCQVFYGNFDLEENHQPHSKMVRSLKRVTEDGIYQAAYEGRIECGVTLSALSIWHAFESVRKKRVANSKRTRSRAADEEDDVE